MATSLTHKYIPRIRQTEENLFIEEYYSNTDVKIYIEGVEQTEISYISYSLQEQLKPLYGYASSTFDDVAIGNRIVTGILKTPINNIESNHTEQDIIERSNNENSGYISPDIYDYNLKQDMLADDIEWIGSTDTVPETPQENEDEDSIKDKPSKPTDEIPKPNKPSSGIPGEDEPSNEMDGEDSGEDSGEDDEGFVLEDDERYEYIVKLLSLDYTLSTNCTEKELSKVIKNFQYDEGDLEISGLLDDLTRQRIDEKTTQDDKLVLLPHGAKVHVQPSPISGFEIYNMPIKIGILERYANTGFVKAVLINLDVVGYINLEELEEQGGVVE